MHHDETGSRAVGQRLLDPFFAVPEFAGLQLDADMATMPLERAGFGGPSGHSNLAHHRVQEIVSIWRLLQNPVAGFDQSARVPCERKGRGVFVLRLGYGHVT
jgi:hypothetical protein